MISIPLAKAGELLVSKVAEKGLDIISKKLMPEEISLKFGNAVDNVSLSLQKKYPSVLGGSIDIFFKEEEIFNELFKLLFRQSKINIETIEKNFDIATLPTGFVEEFIKALKLELLKDKVFDDIFSNNELYVSIIGIDENTEKIALDTELSKHDISEIKELLKEKYEDTFSYDDFISAYKKTVINNLSQVNYIGLGISPHIMKNRKQLQDIYIKPHFIMKNTREVKLSNDDPIFIDLIDNDYIEFPDLFNRKKHIVILGDPGAGKSLLSKFIMCIILEGNKNEFNNQEIYNLLPFRIELRKYLTFKKANTCNISKYIRSIIETDCGISNITENQIEKILRQKDTIIFFDGLDEIFDINDKIEIKNDIENFVVNYKRSNILVTSRLIGYDDAKLNEKYFEEIHIQEFDEDQIKSYVENWYSLEEDNEDIRNTEINEFLNIVDKIEDELIRNPLLLSLIVILYRHNRELPSSKLEIYRSCTKTLTDKWDENKKLEININEKMKVLKDNIFSNLAYWQYQQLSNKEMDIKYVQVLNQVTTILIKLKITDNEFEAATWAEKFLDYAKNRSIYFDNNFTHKTFLEYYTAFWIYKYYCLKGNITDRNAIINKYIGNSFWSIVLELLINMIDEDQGDNDVIDELINEYIDKNNKSFTFLLRILPSLKHISDSVLISLFNSIFLFCINRVEFDNDKEDIIRGIVPSLIRILKLPKFKVIIQHCYDKLYNLIKQDEQKLLYYFLISFEINHYQSINLNANLLNYSYEKHKNELERLSRTDYRLFLISLFEGKCSPEKSIVGFVKTFGYENLKQPYQSVFTIRFRGSIFRFFLNDLLRINNIALLPLTINHLKDQGLTISYINQLITAEKSIIIRDDSVGVIKELINIIINYEKDKDIMLVTLLLLFKLKRTLMQRGKFFDIKEKLPQMIYSIPYQNFINEIFNENMTFPKFKDSLYKQII